MNKKYTEYCMKFSNEELKKYIYDKISENIDIQIQCLSENEEQVDITSNARIETISFDEKENVSIMFFGYQTSIFVYDAEIMFIDEDTKGSYMSSEVYGNAVYEGKLREMSHEEMLQMFSEIILCFIDAAGVSLTTLDVPENKYKKYKYYTPHMFILDVENNHLTQKVNVYENITIKY